MSESPATLQAIFDRVVQMQTQMGQMQAELGQFRETVFDRFARLQAQLERMQAQLEQMRTQVEQIRAELGQVHTEQDQLRHELAQLDARVTQNHAEVLGHIERLDRKLDVMAENRIVDFATAERAEKIALDTQRQTSALVTSLSEQVNGMWRAPPAAHRTTSRPAGRALPAVDVRIVPGPSGHGELPKRPKGSDCKSAVIDFGGSNPSLATIAKPRLGGASGVSGLGRPSDRAVPHRSGRRARRAGGRDDLHAGVAARRPPRRTPDRRRRHRHPDRHGARRHGGLHRWAPRRAWGVGVDTFKITNTLVRYLTGATSMSPPRPESTRISMTTTTLVLLGLASVAAILALIIKAKAHPFLARTGELTFRADGICTVVETPGLERFHILASPTQILV